MKLWKRIIDWLRPTLPPPEPTAGPWYLYVVVGGKRGREPEIIDRRIAVKDEVQHEPWYRRRSRVRQALKEAELELGEYFSYERAIAYVRATTGEGCSRRAVSEYKKWKKAQNREQDPSLELSSVLPGEGTPPDCRRPASRGEFDRVG